MSTNSLVRWGGLAALIGGLIGIGGDIAHAIVFGSQSLSEAAVTPAWGAILGIMDLATVLILLGLIALYLYQYLATGIFGFIAFALALFGTMMTFGHQWSSTFVVPVLATGTPDFLDTITTDTTTVLAGGVFLSAFLMAVGWFLFGLASLKAKVYHIISIWLVIIGALLILILDLIQFDLDKVVLYLGVTWMAWWLWRDR